MTTLKKDEQLKADAREVIVGLMSPDHIVHHSKLELYKAETKIRFIELYRRINFLQDCHYHMFKEMDENIQVQVQLQVGWGQISWFFILNST